MGFLGIFSSYDEQELKDTNKYLTDRVKQQEERIEELRIELDEKQDKADRWRAAEIRELRNELADVERRHSRDTELLEEAHAEALRKAEKKAKQEADSRIEAAEEKHKSVVKGKDETIAELRSEVRDLNLAAEEAVQDIDLAVQEGILEYKEKNLGELAKLQVKVASLEGDIKAAKAEADAKGVVIKALEKQNETSASQVSDAMELVGAVAPKVNLEKLGFEITVPAQAKQGGGDQKKQ